MNRRIEWFVTVNEARPMERRDGGEDRGKQKRRRTGPLVVFLSCLAKKGQRVGLPFLSRNG